MKTVTCLAAARRTLFGSLEAAARKAGFSHTTQHRAETGRAVSDKVRRRIERLYRAPLEDLQRPL